jgi:hypothetical protein
MTFDYAKSAKSSGVGFLGEDVRSVASREGWIAPSRRDESFGKTRWDSAIHLGRRLEIA